MRKIYLAALLIFISLNRSSAQSVTPFRGGDRVVFVGNSITDGGHYHSYIYLYYLTHFPERHITFYNAGIGGDVAQQMFDRLDSDALSRKPTVLTLTFGMNDTGYQNLKGAKADSVYKEKTAVALAAFDKIVTKLKQHPEVRKVMIGSSSYDETAKIKAYPLIKKNAYLRQIAAAQQSVAKVNGWEYVDFGTPMTAINQREQQRDSTFTLQGSDRIHPTNDGQMVMAYEFLKAQGLNGKPVAVVDIDNRGEHTSRSENCTVSGLRIGNSTITFQYLAKSLPYPMDTIPGGFGRPGRSQAQALGLIPFTKEFNQEVLRISDLKAGNYRLKIDGREISTWKSDELAAGINLAEAVNTPQYQQALAVMHLNEERWSIERRLREYYWIHYSILKPKGLLFNDGLATVDSLQKYARKDFFVAVTLPTYQKARFQSVRDSWQKEIDLLTARLYEINRPVTHQFEITRIN